jgi:hypothetical protein
MVFSVRKMFPFVLLCLSVLGAGSLTAAFGQIMNSTVGVARGEVFTYGYTCYFNSNDSTAVPPSSFSWINQTGYFKCNVTNVSGSEISLGTLMHGLNGQTLWEYVT